MFRASLCAALLWGLATPTFADSLPLKKTLQLGKPPRPVTIEVSAEPAQLTIAGRRQGLTLNKPARAEVRAVGVGKGAVAVLEISGTEQQVSALIGGPRGNELLWSGDTALKGGDPGERSAQTVQVDGQVVRVGQRHERARRCDGKSVVFAARQVSPRSLKLTRGRALVLPGDPVDIAATGQPPASLNRPLLPALRWKQAWNEPSKGMTPVGAQVLSDGRQETTWRPQGDSAFAIAAWEAPELPPRALAFQFRGSRPRAVLLITEAQVLRIGFDGVEAADGGKVWAELPNLGTSSCLMLAFEGAGRATELGELQAFTALDFGGGLDELVQRLVRDGQDAARAAQWLSRIGRPAAVAVLKAWPNLSARGKRRALGLLGSQLDTPGAGDTLVKTALEGSSELSQRAVQVLSKAGPRSSALLGSIAKWQGPVADSAAKHLARRKGGETYLLAALGEEGGAARPELRRAVGLKAKLAPDAMEAASRTWIAAGASVASQAALALALSQHGRRDVAREVALGLLAKVETFEDRFRLAFALASLPAEPAGDGWLKTMATSAEEWMMREAALTALDRRKSPSRFELSARGLSDTYPRVRLRAVQQLDPGKQLTALVKQSQQDTWPSVRAAAVRRMGQGDAAARMPVRRALDDGSRFVRQAAIEAMVQQRDVEAWPQVALHLTNNREWLSVKLAAVNFAQTLCVDSARPELVDRLRVALSAEASDDDAELALAALRALHALGGEAWQEALKISQRKSAPPGLGKAANRLGKSACEASRKR